MASWQTWVFLTIKIQTIDLYTYAIPLKNNQKRMGMLINIHEEHGENAWGEVAPFVSLSKETFQDVILQFQQKKHAFHSISWSSENCFRHLAKLQLFPSFSFGLETAVLSFLAPL